MALAAAGVGAAVQLCAAVSYAPPAAWVVVICDAVAVASFFLRVDPPPPRCGLMSCMQLGKWGRLVSSRSSQTTQGDVDNGKGIGIFITLPVCLVIN